jgi:hypothetical protein
LAAGERPEDAGLEPERRLLGRREQQKLVTDKGELGDELAASHAAAHVGKRRISLLLGGDASAGSVVCARPISAVIGHHQLRAELQHGRAGPRLHRAQRQPSSSLIARAVKPLEGGQDLCAPLFLVKPSHWLPQ